MALNNGQKTWESNDPGREGELNISGIAHAAGADPSKKFYADILELGPLGSLLQAGARGYVKNPTASGVAGEMLGSTTSHVGPLLSALGGAKENQGPNFQPIVSPGMSDAEKATNEAAAAVARAAPIGISNYNRPGESTPLAAGSQLTGVRISSGPAAKAAGSSTKPTSTFGGAPRRTPPLGGKGGSYLTPSPSSSGRRTPKLG
jgi:hypothetical protein